MAVKSKLTGLALATAAAALFSSGMVLSTAAQAAGEKAEVKCAGINACKGQSACKSATNDCKGQNACKGQGWVSAKSKEECTKQGGKVVEG